MEPVAGRATVARAAVIAGALLHSRCGHPPGTPALHWPWHSGPSPTARSSTACQGRPPEGAAWLVRLAFRLRPGAIGVLEVRADQRLNLPITPAAGKPIELELAPRMYTSRTKQMSVTWGPISPPDP